MAYSVTVDFYDTSLAKPKAVRQLGLLTKQVTSWICVFVCSILLRVITYNSKEIQRLEQ